MEKVMTTTTLTPIEIALGVDEKGMTTARKLYEFLELAPSQFARWAKKAIEKNEFYEEGTDWWGFDIMSNGNKCKNYKLTTDFAKHLSMESHSTRGKEARDYFVAIENKAKTDILNIQDIMLQPLSEMKTMIMAQSVQISKLTDSVTELCSVVKELLVSKQSSPTLMTDGDAVTVEEAAEILTGKGYTISTERLYKFMQDIRLTRATQSKLNLPLRRSITNGFLTTSKQQYENDGVIESYEITMVTPVGLDYLMSKMGKATSKTTTSITKSTCS